MCVSLLTARTENAGLDGKYFWSQSLSEVYVRIPVPGTLRGTRVDSLLR